MLPDRVSNPGPLTYESGALPIAPRGPAESSEIAPGFRHAIRRLENSRCHPSSCKWVPFSNQGRIKQRKERDDLRLSSAVPKIQWDCVPYCPYGYYAMGNLYLFTISYLDLSLVDRMPEPITTI